MKRSLVLCLAVAFMLLMMPMVHAEEDVTSLATGLIVATEEELEALIDEEYLEAMQNPAAGVLPSSVDNSQSIYFPPIGDQGSQGSCTAWATTYYTFTYEVNRLHNTAADTASRQYSPASTYNVLAKNNLFGLRADDVFKYLQSHGAVTLADLPYDAGNHTAVASADAMRNAMHTRVKQFNTFPIDTSVVPAQGNSANMDTVRTLLSEGHVLPVGMFIGYITLGWTEGTVEEPVIFRNAYLEGANNGAHMMTIVGYDDAFSYDVNGDGTIENAEKGAFKLANSGGAPDDLSDTGYWWVLYDALNVQSQISGDWESHWPYERICAFAQSGQENTENWVYRMIVKDYEPMLLAEVNLTLTDKERYREYIASHQTSLELLNQSTVYYNLFSDSSVVTPTLYFDYDELVQPIENYLANTRLYYWLDTQSVAENTIHTAKVTDNLGNEIMPFSTTRASAKGRYADLELAYGDVNYDQQINMTDAYAVYARAAGGAPGSYLREELSDYNRDGEVDMRDASALFAVAGGGE